MNRPTADDEKRARLAAALRENLKRRKAQARARDSAEPDGQDTNSPTGSSPGDNDNEKEL